jgi:tetratricopeptide (TPR) repeat protein
MFDIAETLSTALDRHQAGARDEAEMLYRRVLEVEPKEPTALYLYGLFNFEAGKVEAANELLSAVVEARPENAEAHVALANLSYWRGRHDDAVGGYRRALDIQPDHPVALINLAGALRDRGDFNDAIDACRIAVSHLPCSAPAHAALAGALAAAGRPGEAVEAYRAAIERAPEDVASRAAMALALLDAGQPQAALTAADQTLQLNAEVADAWFVRGAALMTLRKPAEAAAALEKAAVLDPERAGICLTLGNAYAELDRPDDAVEQLSRAVTLDPTLKEAHASLGSVLYRCGEPDSAESFCWLALASDPDMPIAHQNLAAIHADRGDLDQARHHRDMAYRKQSLFVEPAPYSEATVLVLTTARGGNIPHKYILPDDRFTRLNWFIEYAHEGQAAELPPYDVVFNIIGDPDLSEATDAAVDAFLAAGGRAVLNDPAKVARTRRDRIPALLGDIEGVVVPKVARLDAEAIAIGGLEACIEATGLSYPLLVRPIGSHGGKGLMLARKPYDLEDFELGAASGVYVTEYRNFRTEDDDLFRKYRVIFVDRKPFPYHLAIADEWLVHYETAQMPGAPGRQAEERRFLEDPAAALGEKTWAAVCAIGERLDLDYGGVDFSVLPDGRVLVFEANATMLAHPEDADGEFVYKNLYAQYIFSAFQALLDRRSVKA